MATQQKKKNIKNWFQLSKRRVLDNNRLGEPIISCINLYADFRLFDGANTHVTHVFTNSYGRFVIERMTRIHIFITFVTVSIQHIQMHTIHENRSRNLKERRSSLKNTQNFTCIREYMGEPTSAQFVQLLPVLTGIYTMYVIRIRFFIFLISCFPPMNVVAIVVVVGRRVCMRLILLFVFLFFSIYSSRNEFPENICFVRSFV